MESLWNDAPVVDLAAEAGLTDIEYSERIAKFLEKAKAKKDAADAEVELDENRVEVEE